MAPPAPGQGSADKASKVKSLLASYYDTEGADDEGPSLHDTPRCAPPAAETCVPFAAVPPAALLLLGLDHPQHAVPLAWPRPAADRSARRPAPQARAVACGRARAAPGVAERRGVGGVCRRGRPERHLLRPRGLPEEGAQGDAAGGAGGAPARHAHRGRRPGLGHAGGWAAVRGCCAGGVGCPRPGSRIQCALAAGPWASNACCLQHPALPHFDWADAGVRELLQVHRRHRHHPRHERQHGGHGRPHGGAARPHWCVAARRLLGALRPGGGASSSAGCRRSVQVCWLDRPSARGLTLPCLCRRRGGAQRRGQRRAAAAPGRGGGAGWRAAPAGASAGEPGAASCWGRVGGRRPF